MQTVPYDQRMLYAKFGWKWSNDSWEDDFKIWSLYFSLFCYHSLEKGGPFICSFEQTWIPFTKECFVPSLDGEEDLEIFSMSFLYFVIISPWKRAGPFIWTNYNLLYPRMLCVKFGWLSGPREEGFLNFINVFSLFCYYLPLGKGGPFIWKN